jgi:hypothetical protein
VSETKPVEFFGEVEEPICFSPSSFWDNSRMEEEEDRGEASTPVNEEILARDLAMMAKS